MKRQKYGSLLLSLLFLLQISACAPDRAVSADPLPSQMESTDTPGEGSSASALSPLPSGSTVDWNDIPEVWEGTGGTEKTTWLGSRVYQSAVSLSYDSTSEQLQEGLFNLYLTLPTYGGLKDPQLSETINQWSAAASAELQDGGNPLERYLTEDIRTASLLDGYSSISPNHFLSGNLLSVSVDRYDAMQAYDEAEQSLLAMYDASAYRCAVYDLRTGRQLTLSDLFVDGTDLHRLLDPLIAEKLAASENETNWNTFRSYGGLIRPFRGLPRDYPYFMVSDSYLMLYFPYGNPYLSESYTVYLPLDALADHLAQPVMDNTSFVTESVDIYTQFRAAPSMTNTADNYDLLNLFGDEQLGIRPYRLKDALQRPAIDQVNAEASDIYAALHDAPLPDWLEAARQDPGCYSYAGSALMSNQAFITLQISVYAGISGSGEIPQYQVLSRTYDAETGEALPLSAVLRDTDAALAELAAQGLHLSGLESHYNWYCYSPDGEIYIGAENGMSPTYTLARGYFDTDILE